MTPHARSASVLIENDRWQRFRSLPAAQQPDWPDRQALANVLANLSSVDLVSAEDTRRLLDDLTSADSQGGLVLQVGDCVEDIDGDVYFDTRRRLGFIEALADGLESRTGRPVITVGRIAGQHAKPRSSAYEVIDGTSLPSYRGPIVNAPAPHAAARRPDPARIAHAYRAALRAHEAIADHQIERPRRTVWTSHELLLIDYELSFLREDGELNRSASTHWPWVGARTRQLDGAHLAIASSLSNPVSVKIGPDTSPDEAVRIAQLLNPDDHPSKLTFIARFGAARIDEIDDIAAAIARRAPRVRWISDPMHGNTVSTSRGTKTRHVEDIVDELRRFQQVLRALRIHPAGIHLEATPDHVHECTVQGQEPKDPRRYRTLLDPRLDPHQTLRVLDAWDA